MTRDPRFPRAIVVLACALSALSACEDSRPSPPSSPPPSGETITGRERIGWDQPASDAAELASFQYALYVDGARVVLTAVACDAAPRTEGFGCSAPLPPLTPGPHVLELAAVSSGGGAVLESGRSAPLRVNVSASLPGTVGATTGAADVIATADGVRLAVEVVVTGLTDPVDFAQAPDGRFFVAERAGRVLVVEPAGDRLDVAVTLDAVDVRGDGGLLSIALHPAFDRTRLVYLVYTSPDGAGGRTFQLERFREAGGRLAERAVLLDAVPASPRTAASSLRFGPDGMLYVSFDAAEQPERPDDLASFNGKILRMDAGGGLPEDNPLPSLVYSSGHQGPRGFDWQPETGVLWLIDRGASQRDELLTVAPGRPAGAARWLLSRGLQPGASGAAFLRADAMPGLRGDLFVAAADGGHLLRVRFDPRDLRRPSAREPLLAGRFGRISQVVAGRGRAIYFSTGNAPDAGVGRDVIVRMRPALE